MCSLCLPKKIPTRNGLFMRVKLSTVYHCFNFIYVCGMRLDIYLETNFMFKTTPTSYR